MIKVLFLIHDLGGGGAEKVLVNLVNNMDASRFDITVVSMFGGGVNEKFLKPHIHYRTVFRRMIPANSKIMKLFSPKALHRFFIKEQYDIEVSYLEGPSARVISGCKNADTKKATWIHGSIGSTEALSASFRNGTEAVNCYNGFDSVICVSNYIKEIFLSLPGIKSDCRVLYNTVESDEITRRAVEPAVYPVNDGAVSIAAVGKLEEGKGCRRLIGIIKRLKDEGFRLHLYFIGEGSLRGEMEKMIKAHSLENCVTLVGYDPNPYKYVAKCDLFVCASFSEGFSTAATEALIVGTPVVTTLVSGMKEMLGENNEYGVVTENSEEGLYNGIKMLLSDKELLAHYKKQAEKRGRDFNTENTVRAVEDMLLGLLEGE